MEPKRRTWTQSMVRSIMPAAQSFAVYKNDKPEDWFVKPVVGWCIVDPIERYSDTGDRAPKTFHLAREIAPMIQSNGVIHPETTYSSDQMTGTIVAGFYELEECSGFDGRFLNKDPCFDLALCELATRITQERGMREKEFKAPLTVPLIMEPK